MSLLLSAWFGFSIGVAVAAIMSHFGGEEID
mgnify:CR=1 FL=1